MLHYNVVEWPNTRVTQLISRDLVTYLTIVFLFNEFFLIIFHLRFFLLSYQKLLHRPYDHSSSLCLYLCSFLSSKFFLTALVFESMSWHSWLEFNFQIDKCDGFENSGKVVVLSLVGFRIWNRQIERRISSAPGGAPGLSSAEEDDGPPDQYFKIRNHQFKTILAKLHKDQPDSTTRLRFSPGDVSLIYFNLIWNARSHGGII